MNRLSLFPLAVLVACDAAPLSVQTAPPEAPQLRLEFPDVLLLLFQPQQVEVELADGRRREAQFHGALRFHDGQGTLVVDFTDLLEERQSDDLLEQVIFFLTEITLPATNEFRFAGVAQLRTSVGEILRLEISGSAEGHNFAEDLIIFNIVGPGVYDQKGGPTNWFADGKGFGFITPVEG